MPNMKRPRNNYSQGALSPLVNGEGSISAWSGVNGVRSGDSFTVVMDGGEARIQMTSDHEAGYTFSGGSFISRAELSLYPAEKRHVAETRGKIWDSTGGRNRKGFI